MAIMTRAQFKKQLQRGLNTVFGLEYKQYREEWRECFRVENSVKAFEEGVIESGFGVAPIKQEGAAVEYDFGEEGWRARFTHSTIALAFAITEEAEEDGLYGSLGAKYSKALARSMQHTKEIHGASVFNNGHDAGGSYNGGDGVPLYSASHPLMGGGTLSNKLATAADISEVSLEAALIQIEGWTDERGIPAAIMAKKLVIPRQLKFRAQRILKGDWQVDSAERNINAMKSMGMFPEGFSVNHRLTDTDAWYIMTDQPEGLTHYVRKKISRRIEGDFSTGNMRYRARERYSFGWYNWRGSFSSEGNG